MLVAGLSIALRPNAPNFATSMAFGLYAASMLLGFAPRLLGLLDIGLSGRAKTYGGGLRLLVGCLLDFSFSLLIAPIMMLAQTVFIVGLAFGRRMIWDAQNRADRSISLKEALHGLWPQLTFGAGAVAVLAVYMPRAIVWASPTLAPLLLAVPFACVTSMRRFGVALTRARLCAIPDELAPAWEIGGPETRPALAPSAQASPAGLQPADAQS